MPKNKREAVRLDAAAVQRIHDEIVSSVWLGADPVEKGGCRDRGLLDSAVNRPFQSAFGEDAYPNILERAAALFHSLVANHCFTDGNKRTAAVALQTFLIANSVVPKFTNAEIYEIARNTASHHSRGVSAKEAYEEIRQELKNRTMPFSQLRSAMAHSESQNELYATLVEARRLIQTALRNMAKEAGAK